MDSLRDVLLNKNLDEPTEVASLRQYVEKEFGITPKIQVSKTRLTLYMPNASAATNLRMRYRELQRYCKLTRKLYIRIG